MSSSTGPAPAGSGGRGVPVDRAADEAGGRQGAVGAAIRARIRVVAVTDQPAGGCDPCEALHQFALGVARVTEDHDVAGPHPPGAEHEEPVPGHQRWGHAHPRHHDPVEKGTDADAGEGGAQQRPSKPSGCPLCHLDRVSRETAVSCKPVAFQFQQGEFP